MTDPGTVAACTEALGPLENKVDALTSSIDALGEKFEALVKSVEILNGQVRSVSTRLTHVEQYQLDDTLPPPEPM